MVKIPIDLFVDSKNQEVNILGIDVKLPYLLLGLGALFLFKEFSK